MPWPYDDEVPSATKTRKSSKPWPFDEEPDETQEETQLPPFESTGLYSPVDPVAEAKQIKDSHAKALGTYLGGQAPTGDVTDWQKVSQDFVEYGPEGREGHLIRQQREKARRSLVSQDQEPKVKAQMETEARTTREKRKQEYETARQAHTNPASPLYKADFPGEADYPYKTPAPTEDLDEYVSKKVGEREQTRRMGGIPQEKPSPYSLDELEKLGTGGQVARLARGALVGAPGAAFEELGSELKTAGVPAGAIDTAMKIMSLPFEVPHAYTDLAANQLRESGHEDLAEIADLTGDVAGLALSKLGHEVSRPGSWRPGVEPTVRVGKRLPGDIVGPPEGIESVRARETQAVAEFLRTRRAVKDAPTPQSQAMFENARDALRKVQEARWRSEEGIAAMRKKMLKEEAGAAAAEERKFPIPGEAGEEVLRQAQETDAGRRVEESFPVMERFREEQSKQEQIAGHEVSAQREAGMDQLYKEGDQYDVERDIASRQAIMLRRQLDVIRQRAAEAEALRGQVPDDLLIQEQELMEKLEQLDRRAVGQVPQGPPAPPRPVHGPPVPTPIQGRQVEVPPPAPVKPPQVEPPPAPVPIPEPLPPPGPGIMGEARKVAERIGKPELADELARREGTLEPPGGPPAPKEPLIPPLPPQLVGGAPGPVAPPGVPPTKIVRPPEGLLRPTLEMVLENIGLERKQAEATMATIDAFASAHGLDTEAFIDRAILSLRKDKMPKYVRTPDGQILETGNRTGIIVKAAVSFAKDEKASIRIFQKGRDVQTINHELGHVFRHQLRQLNPELYEQAKDAYKATERVLAEEPDVVYWDNKAEEGFASAYENYLKSGEAPTSALKAVFAQFKKWIETVYNTLIGEGKIENLTPERKAIFDRMFGGEKKPVRFSAEEAEMLREGEAVRGTKTGTEIRNIGRIPLEEARKIVAETKARRLLELEELKKARAGKKSTKKKLEPEEEKSLEDLINEVTKPLEEQQPSAVDLRMSPSTSPEAVKLDRVSTAMDNTSTSLSRRIKETGMGWLDSALSLIQYARKLKRYDTTIPGFQMDQGLLSFQRTINSATPIAKMFGHHVLEPLQGLGKDVMDAADLWFTRRNQLSRIREGQKQAVTYDQALDDMRTAELKVPRQALEEFARRLEAGYNALGQALVKRGMLTPEMLRDSNYSRNIVIAYRKSLGQDIPGQPISSLKIRKPSAAHEAHGSELEIEQSAVRGYMDSVMQHLRMEAAARFAEKVIPKHSINADIRAAWKANKPLPDAVGYWFEVGKGEVRPELVKQMLEEALKKEDFEPPKTQDASFRSDGSWHFFDASKAEMVEGLVDAQKRIQPFMEWTAEAARFTRLWTFTLRPLSQLKQLMGDPLVAMSGVAPHRWPQLWKGAVENAAKLANAMRKTHLDGNEQAFYQKALEEGMLQSILTRETAISPTTGEILHILPEEYLPWEFREKSIWTYLKRAGKMPFDLAKVQGEIREGAWRMSLANLYESMGAPREIAVARAHRIMTDYIKKSPLGRELAVITQFTKWGIEQTLNLTIKAFRDPLTEQTTLKGLPRAMLWGPGGSLVVLHLIKEWWNRRTDDRKKFYEKSLSKHGTPKAGDFTLIGDPIGEPDENGHYANYRVWQLDTHLGLLSSIVEEAKNTYNFNLSRVAKDAVLYGASRLAAPVRAPIEAVYEIDLTSGRPIYSDSEQTLNSDQLRELNKRRGGVSILTPAQQRVLEGIFGVVPQFSRYFNSPQDTPEDQQQRSVRLQRTMFGLPEYVVGEHAQAMEKKREYAQEWMVNWATAIMDKDREKAIEYRKKLLEVGVTGKSLKRFWHTNQKYFDRRIKLSPSFLRKLAERHVPDPEETKP